MIYVPGNHDEFLRDYYGTHFGGIEVVERAYPRRRRRPPLPRHPRRSFRPRGDAGALARPSRRPRLYVRLVVNRIFNDVRRRLGFGYWSLSQWAKQKVKNAVNYIGEFEKTLVLEAKRNGADGVICGHIHHAAIHDDFGVALHQLRRLGGKLHRHRGASRRPLRDHHLDAQRDATGDVAERGRGSCRAGGLIGRARHARWWRR